MAEIVLKVEVRQGAGTGAARAARRAGMVPGILYGAAKSPVSIAVKAADFGKALHTGKLLGHLVTLEYGAETQPVIAKDVQFHPVTDAPVHFDLYRVEEHQLIRISVPVRFRNHDDSPGLKRGGALNINLHEVEVLAPADQIPEEIAVDLTGLEIGDAVRGADLAMPAGAELSANLKEATVASIAGAVAEAVEPSPEAAAEGEPEAEAEAEPKAE